MGVVFGMSENRDESNFKSKKKLLTWITKYNLFKNIRKEKDFGYSIEA